MRHVKWIFVVLLISSLTSFVEKDKPTGGLNVGDVAPDFTIESTSDVQHNFDLTDLKGKYVLLSFWASYDAQSRMQNASLSNALRSTSQDVEMVSVSFDEYQSVFQETIRKDQIVTPTCFAETKGESSGLFKKYRLNRGFTNYLLDGEGEERVQPLWKTVWRVLRKLKLELPFDPAIPLLGIYPEATTTGKDTAFTLLF